MLRRRRPLDADAGEWELVLLMEPTGHFEVTGKAIALGELLGLVLLELLAAQLDAVGSDGHADDRCADSLE